MAVVIPYGDAQAHGSIADSICFRRHKGKVILQKKPNQRQKRTPAQIVQQERFSDAWVAFHSISLWTLEYLQEKALLTGSSASVIYLSQYLKDQIPSTVKNNFVKEITDLDLPELEGAEGDDVLFEYLARIDAPPGDTLLADIWDNANVFSAGAVASPYDRLVLRLTRDKTSPRTIPFDYPALLWYKNFSDADFINLIRLPEMVIPPPPSNTPRTDCNYGVFSKIYDPMNPGAAFTRQYLEIKTAEPSTWLEIGSRQSAPSTSTEYYVTDPTCLAIRIRFHNTGEEAWVSPDDWRTDFIWGPTGGPDVNVDLIFPAFTLQQTEEISFYISTDNSLYYDDAFTQLAIHMGPKTKELFVAWDFSVYWDAAMTQLANTPYFQP